MTATSNLQTSHCFFFNDPATTDIYTLSLHDALPISRRAAVARPPRGRPGRVVRRRLAGEAEPRDRKSTRLNSSHVSISYAVFCLKKKKNAHLNNSLLVATPAPPYTSTTHCAPPYALV